MSIPKIPGPARSRYLRHKEEGGEVIAHLRNEDERKLPWYLLEGCPDPLTTRPNLMKAVSMSRFLAPVRCGCGYETNIKKLWEEHRKECDEI